MKKLIFAALAVAAMAACTKSNVDFDQQNEIAFQPVSQKATKAAVIGTNYPKGAAYNFNVWAWWADMPKGTTSASTFNTVYISNQEFSYRSSNNWGGKQNPYYWPTTGSLFFAGYSPADAPGDKVYLHQDKKFIVTDYVQSYEIASTKDFMWFHLTDVSYDRTTEAVPVKFHHALSWLTFRVNLTSEATPKLWTVKSITLKGIETKANFTAERSDSADEHGTTSWTAQSLPKDITVFTGSYNVKYVNTPYVAGADDESVLENTDNGVLVIPQECTSDKAELVIEFDQIAPSGNLVSQKKTLSLGTEWLPSRHYVYTITFGAEEILISPTILNWTVVDDLTVPVE